MSNYRNKQTGGTILGLIIGLIIGLGIAVVVAVTIKNTPLPFVDKMGKSDRSSASGKVSDPNKPLYGNREPAKDAARQFARQPDANQPADNAAGGNEAVKADEAKPDAKEPKPKPDAKVPAPVEDKSAAAKVPVDKAADKADEKYTYYLQAGAFLEKADAENTRAKLALLGFSANIVEKQSENGTLYRVRIGPFSQQETMNRMRTKLSDNGIDAAVVRIPK
jgi:cell division protein FtsN